MIKTEKTMASSPVAPGLRNFPEKRRPVWSTEGGSILIGLIVTMVVMAFLGAGMVYMTTTSTYSELFFNRHAAASSVAESGGRYAMSVIRDAYATDKSKLNDVKNLTFTMSDGSTFFITDWQQDGANPETVTFSSIGTVGTGFLQAKRQIKFSIQPANQSGGGGASNTPALPREASDFDVPKQDLDIYYSPVDMSEVDIKDNPIVDSDRTLNLKSDNYTMGLRWYSTLSLAQLDAIRAANGGLLSYGVQVKIYNYDEYTNQASLYNMIGISFRLDDRNDANIADDIDNMYGLSFVKLTKPESNSGPVWNQAPDWYKNFIYPNSAWDDFSSSPTDEKSGKWFIVLWKRVNSGSNSSYQPIKHQKLTSSDSVCHTGTANYCTLLKPWSTLMVYVKEQSSGTNHITAYFASTNTYPRSTASLQRAVQWADANTTGTVFTAVSWPGTSGSTDPITNAKIVQDSTLTTLNYENYNIGDTSQTKAREIGLHIFCTSTSAMNVFYDNFYIDLTPSGSGYADGSGSVIQYP